MEQERERGMHNENRVRTPRSRNANNNIATTAERASGRAQCSSASPPLPPSLPPTGLGEAPLGKHKLQDFPLLTNISLVLTLVRNYDDLSGDQLHIYGE